MKRTISLLLSLAIIASTIAFFVHEVGAAIKVRDYRQGATGPAYGLQVKDYVAGLLTPFDLTGTTITCTMRSLRSGANVFTNRAATVYDATVGKVMCRWQAGDLATVGEYAIQFKIIGTDGSIYIIPAGEDAQIVVGTAY